MATDRWDELDASNTAEERTRVAVAWLARAALAVSLAGAVTGTAAPTGRTTTQHYVALALCAAGLVAGLLCLLHGVRHQHERGRVFAVAAIVVAVAPFVFALGGFLRFRPGETRGP
jgi:cytochrome bd-type quinol oxidase subunit 2